jgi:plasmid stabilization system protein ParE
MTRLVVAPVAIRDLAKVLGDLTEDAGERVAAKYRQSFLRLFTLLEAQPGLGAPRPRLGQGIRLGIVAPYLVFYREQSDLVTVLRVLHGRQKIDRAKLRET